MNLNQWLLIPVTAVLLLTGCTNKLSATPEEIIGHVMQSEEQKLSYMGEGEMKFYMNEEMTEHMAFEEYVHADGRRAIVMSDLNKDGLKSFTWNDGKQVISYEEGSDKAHSIDMSGLEGLGGQTQREQLLRMLERLKETHTYQIVGEEKVAGLSTHHLKVTANESDSLFGDMEFWVDPKSWFVVKANSQTGDVRSETVYTKLELEPQFDESVFAVDLPEHVVVTPIGDEFPTYTGTLAEAEAALGRPFLVLEGTDPETAKAEWHVYDGALSRTEVSVSYIGEDGIPELTLTVFPTPEDARLDNNQLVRGKQGGYMDVIRLLSWDEDGLRYGILIDHPDLTLEDVLERAESMVLSDTLASKQ